MFPARTSSRRATLPSRNRSADRRPASGTSGAAARSGQTGDTVQGQVNELNAQLNVLGISASLNQSGVLQFQSGNAFSVSAIANNQNASGAGDVLTINVGSNKTAAITIAGATTQDMATQINQALQTAGISGVSAVVDATT